MALLGKAYRPTFIVLAVVIVVAAILIWIF